MKKVILVRYGEIILKGLNRPVFEDKLMGNIKKSLYGLGKISVSKSQARIYIEPQSEDYEYKGAMERLTRVSGIVSVSPVWRIDTDFEQIKDNSVSIVNEILSNINSNVSFKVETKRGNKNFPMKSPEISSEIGAYLLSKYPVLTVDVINPDFILYIEVREFTYLYCEIIPAYGGLPVGTNGKALLLLSGGIDSPVAGWMMAKRGVEIEAVHFYSYPYTSERSKEKVIKLTEILSSYCFHVRLHIVPFTAIQEEINDKAPHDQMTIIMRRVMMKISERIAQSTGCLSLITGESMGQVASQTMQSLAVTNSVVGMPVFRPLIGMDKNEAVNIARKIGTFETSILPYEDCCTVFTAKHPETKPRINNIMLSESRLDNLNNLLESAISNVETIDITNVKV